jgi:hypothetical protein
MIPLDGELKWSGPDRVSRKVAVQDGIRIVDAAGGGHYTVATVEWREASIAWDSHDVRARGSAVTAPAAGGAA